MAQVLKEESRELILDAARDEFLENGYKGSSMRRIAQKSKMTVGNLYRYFKNKEDLLEVIVAPVYKGVNKLLGDLTDNAVSFENDSFNIDASVDELSVMLDKLSDDLVDIYVKHKLEFNILMMSSRLNDEMTSWFANLINTLINKQYGKLSDAKNVDILSKSYATAIFTGIREMMKIADVDIDSIKVMTKIYLNSYLSMLQFDVSKYVGR